VFSILLYPCSFVRVVLLSFVIHLCFIGRCCLTVTNFSSQNDVSNLLEIFIKEEIRIQWVSTNLTQFVVHLCFIGRRRYTVMNLFVHFRNLP
jgi:hypothetical protein